MDLNNISTRHIGAQEIILYMAAYAPAFGMLGTVLGLIIMMNKFQMSGETSSIDFNVADQFSSLLTGMGTALITTFYGVFLANMVFLPIAGKLKRRSENEILSSVEDKGIKSLPTIQTLHQIPELSAIIPLSLDTQRFWQVKGSGR